MSDVLRIPRTRQLRRRIKLRMKFILGRSAQLGACYKSVCDVRGCTVASACRVRCYNWHDGLLTLESDEGRTIVLLSGDVTVWCNVLYADAVCSTIALAEPIDETIRRYVQEHGYARVTRDLAVRALTARYPKIGSAIWKKAMGGEAF